MAETSVIGSSTVIRGNVRGEGDIEVLGRIEGDLIVTGNVTLGEDAQVRGSVSGAAITVNGSVTGDLTGSVAVVLGETAHVTGDLITPRVGIAEGARIRGRINTQDGAGRESRAAAEAHVRRELPRRGTAPKAHVSRPEPAHQVAAASKPQSVSHAAPEKRKLPPPPVVPALRKGARARKKVRR